jgi:hypothetical protein
LVEREQVRREGGSTEGKAARGATSIGGSASTKASYCPHSSPSDWLSGAEHGETRRAIRTTLVSLAVAAQRVRYLAERGEIEVDDLPPPAVPPTPAKVN